MPTRRRLHLLIALLLPLMALRAMLPAGYMPMAQDGQVRIVMCSGGLAAVAEPGAPAAPHGDSNDSCVFAHAAHAAPPPAILPFAAPIPPLVSPVDAGRHPDVFSPLRRAQSPRAPPHLS